VKGQEAMLTRQSKRNFK